MSAKHPVRWTLLAIAVGAIALLAATPTSGPPSPWQGTWWSIDPYDGSLVRVTFGGDHRGHFNYIDWGASVCGTDAEGDPLYAARAAGWAANVDATSFEGSAPVVCITHPPFVWDPSWTFGWTYDPATNTLSDGTGIWTRTRP